MPIHAAIDFSQIGPWKKFASIADLFNTIIPNVMVLAGIILFILIIAGGIMVIRNAGSGDAQATEKGKKAITAAVIGFLLIFTAYWLVKIVEFITGITILPL